MGRASGNGGLMPNPNEERFDEATCERLPTTVATSAAMVPYRVPTRTSRTCCGRSVLARDGLQ